MAVTMEPQGISGSLESMGTVMAAWNDFGQPIKTVFRAQLNSPVMAVMFNVYLLWVTGF